MADAANRFVEAIAQKQVARNTIKDQRARHRRSVQGVASLASRIQRALHLSLGRALRDTDPRALRDPTRESQRTVGAPSQRSADSKFLAPVQRSFVREQEPRDLLTTESVETRRELEPIPRGIEPNVPSGAAVGLLRR